MLHDGRCSAVLRRWNYVTWNWVLKMGFVGFDWKPQAYHMVHWWAFVNTVMNLCVPLNHGTFFFARWEKLSSQERPCVLELFDVTLLVTGWRYVNYWFFTYFLNHSISDVIVECYERKPFKLTLLGIRTYNHYNFSFVLLSSSVGWRGEDWVNRLRYLIDVVSNRISFLKYSGRLRKGWNEYVRLDQAWLSVI